ncbi:MAG: sensor histidine kinase [Candidatus Pristimantibacillus sp.]
MKLNPLHKPEGAKRSFIPFGIKLFISYIVLIIVPIFIFGYIANSILVDSIRSQTTNTIKGTLEQMKDNMLYKIEDTYRISDYLYFDANLSKKLMHFEEGWINYETTTKELLPKIRQTVDSTNRQVWLTVYLRNESLPEVYYDSGNKDPLKMKGAFFDVLHLKRITNKSWYTSFPQEKYGDTLQWKQIEDDTIYERISLLRRLVDTTDPTYSNQMKEIGFMRISVYLSDLFQSVDHQKIGSGTTLFITNKTENIIYASDEQNQTDAQIWRDARGDNHLVIEQELPDLGWSLVAMIPTTVLEEDAKKVSLLTLIICILCCVVISIVAFMMSRFFSKRILKLMSVLQSFRQGDFQRRVHYSGNDEFTTIALSLNELGKKTQNLIEEVYMTNLKKKEAELEILQAQINPHFLYNTLSSISRLAKFGKVEQQHQMVMNLAKFYRLSLNEGQTIIPIYKEIEQVQAYMDIQQIRYGNRVDIHYDVDPAIINYSTVKLILQPFVENTLEHAWRGDHIDIRIVGYRVENMICFEIIDDGIGISQEIIRHLFVGEDLEKIGYGIRNVHERMILYYGKEYGVTIESELGKGTCVRITIPVQRQDGDQMA